jgi:hypothetical protein
MIAATMLTVATTGALLAQQPPLAAPVREPAPPPPPGPAQQPVPPPPPVTAAKTTAVQGTVAQYMLNPDGVVDGFLLSDNTIVRFPPHLSQQLVQKVKPQDQVQIDGLVDLQGVTHAVTITDTSSQQSITDTPPPQQNPASPPDRSSRQPMNASGTIKVLTHARQGEIDGAVLDDGTIVHLPPSEGIRFANILAVGSPLSTTGYGTANAYGHCLEVTAIGPSASQMQNVAAADGGPDRPGHRRPAE